MEGESQRKTEGVRAPDTSQTNGRRGTQLPRQQERRHNGMKVNMHTMSS